MSIIPFNYKQIKIIESCWINETPYFTRRAIGEWLGAKNPQNYVNYIIKRNMYIDKFSVSVNLTSTDDKNYNVKVYNPIGLQLIINKSNLPKAIQFQVAVATLVSEMMNKTLYSNYTQYN